MRAGGRELRGDRRSLTAGELACHPVAVTALAVLVVNDWWLKSAWPGFVTGKLSDCAGLVLLPIGLLSVIELLRRIFRRPVAWRYDALVWVALSVIGFVFVKVTPVGSDAYSWAIGIIRWAPQALLYGSGPPVRPIHVARDQTDLLALAFSALPVALIRKRTRAGIAAFAAEHPTSDTPAALRWTAQTGR